MSDIRIGPGGAAAGQPFQAVDLDLLLTPSGQFDDRDQLATAVTVALMTDALAQPDDILPDARDDDRRGWWGNHEAEAIWDGWPIGSRLWLLARTTITGAGARKGATTVQVEAYIREALQPFLDRRIASALKVSVVRAGLDRIDARIVLLRGGKTLVDLRFADLWAGVAIAAPTDLP